MLISKIITTNANYFITNGAKPGHNGCYHNPETKVRMNSHWAITLLKAYEITKESKYKKSAVKCLDYLCSKEARPFGFTFNCREGKDKCNGLIGQAWAIESLMQGYKVLKDRKYKELAKNVFKMHEFNMFWKKREINGRTLSYDFTFNHQLWFAASGSLIDKRLVTSFMDRLEKNVSIHKNGLIRHFIFPKFSIPANFIKTRKSIYNKEVGYHAFNLYAFALLRKKFPMHKFWKSEKFRKISDYAMSKEHFAIAETSKYGMQYNPSGIELAFFNKSTKLLKKQFKNHLDKKTLLMNMNTSDPDVLSSRIYEVTRLEYNKIF